MEFRFSCKQTSPKSTVLADGSAVKYLALGLLVAVTALPASVMAQEARSISVGETRLTPEVRLDYVSIDNLFRQSDDTVSATGFIVAPELSWQADRRLLLLEASYKGAYGIFSEDEADYDDHSFQLRAVGDLASRHRLLSSISVNFDHEDQGIGQTRGATETLPELIERSLVNARLVYIFGAKEARGNLRGGLTLGSVSYSNLEEFTEGDDFTVVRPFGVFSYRVSPDTRLSTEIGIGVLDFDDNSRDRTEVSLLVGFEMGESSRLGGNARIGVLRASFDELSSADTTELIAEVGVNYELTSFSRLDFSLDRSFETIDETNDSAGRSIIDEASLDWSHQWSSRFETVTSLGFSRTDRECPSTDEETVSAGVEFNYSIRRWLQFGVSGRHSTRDATVCAESTIEPNVQDFDRTLVGIHLRSTL